MSLFQPANGQPANGQMCFACNSYNCMHIQQGNNQLYYNDMVGIQALQHQYSATAASITCSPQEGLIGGSEIVITNKPNINQKYKLLLLLE